ncbi:hypothetical protein NHQ30_001143 [Ciborinia camelliae]|nr:hypothetical protein NHQ30_001143 [Ciborinia camelliae]
MPPQSQSPCTSCTDTTKDCQNILTQVILSLENASQVYRKLVPFVRRSHERHLLGNDVYAVDEQLRRGLERLHELDITSENGKRVLGKLVGGNGSAGLSHLPLFRNVGEEEKMGDVKEEESKGEMRSPFHILELAAGVSDMETPIPFLDSALGTGSTGLMEEFLLDNDEMVYRNTIRVDYITPEFPYLLKAIRLWLEEFFESKYLDIPGPTISQLAKFEMDFGLERLPTTSCIWNPEYQNQRKEVFTTTSSWGPNQRQKCECRAEGREPDHRSDLHCPKRMPRDLDLPGVKYIWNNWTKLWRYDLVAERYDPVAEMVQRSKRKKAEGAERAWEEIMSMTGLNGVKEHVRKLKAKVENSVRQNSDLKEERFSAVFMGNSGTGKTTMARIYAKYLYSMGITRLDEVLETTGTYLSDGGIERKKRYVDEIHGGVMFIDDAMTLGNYSDDTQILDFLFREIDRKKGSTVFILAGHEEGMRKLLGHGTKSVASLLPNVLTFDDFSEPELLDILSSCIKKKFDGKMEVEGGYDGLYMRIAARRVSRTRGGTQFGNARAVENLVAQIWERQSARLSKIRKERATKAAEDEAAKEKTGEDKTVESIVSTETLENKEEKPQAEGKNGTEQNSKEEKVTDQETETGDQQNSTEAAAGSNFVAAKENAGIPKDDKETNKGVTEPLREKSSLNEPTMPGVLELPNQGNLLSESRTKEESISSESIESLETIKDSNGAEEVKSEEPKIETNTSSSVNGVSVVDGPIPKRQTPSFNTKIDEQIEATDKGSSNTETSTKNETEEKEEPSEDKLSDGAKESAETDSESGSDREKKEDLLFTKEDILGPDPSAAILKSEAWQELQKLIGLEKVKKSLLTLLELVKANYQRELEEKPLHQFTLNRLFMGPAGTGKTVVAKLYAKILGEIGVLSKGEVIFRNPSDLIGQHIGKSEANTKAALNAARGNVLVIDEAYMMYSGNSDGTGNESDSYRQGVINTLVAEVQGNPGDDLCVLLLGYKEPMLEMLNHSNPGLSRRFPVGNAFWFENFSIDELEKILRSKLEFHVLEATEDAIKVAMDVLQKASTRLNFGNGGEVENLIATARSNYQMRMAKIPVEERPDIWVFQPEDFDLEHDRSAHANLRKLFGDVVGCESIVKQLGQYQNVCQAMKSRDIDPRKYIPTNFVFKGPPGTGKTTTARKFAKVYYDMGFLSDDTVIECSASDLVGKYIGHSGPKTAKVLEKALGKVLFIDEAYRLAPHTESYSFTSEVVSELVDLLTKPKFHGNLIVILAGYEDEINSLLAANPGLASRFPDELNFPALKPLHCLQILEMKLGLAGITIPILKQTQQREYEQLLRLMTLLTATHSWGNARDVETLAKAICRTVFLEMVGEGDLVCTAENAAMAIEVMLHERRQRAHTALPLPRYE